VLLKMLHRFDLIIPTEMPVGGLGAPTRVHSVPCMLPNAPAQASASEEGSNPWCSLYFDFHGLLCRLLPTLFPRLVVASSRQMGMELVNSLGLYRDNFRLVFMGQELAMDLLPAGRPQVMRVRLGCDDAETQGLSVDVVRGLLKLVKAALSHNNHLSFTAGILCEHCHKRGRSRSERYHVIDVSELISDGTAACRISARLVSVPEGCWAAAWRAQEREAAARRTLEQEMSGPHGLAQASRQQSRSRPASAVTALPGALEDASEWPAECLEESCSRPMSSPAQTVQTEASLMASLASQWQSAGAQEPICLLYASPLWRDGESGGELPALDVQEEAVLLAEAAGMAAPVRIELLTASNLTRFLTTALSERQLALHLSLHCAEGGQKLLLEDAGVGKGPPGKKGPSGPLGPSCKSCGTAVA
jgi:hypothetical protein